MNRSIISRHIYQKTGLSGDRGSWFARKGCVIILHQYSTRTLQTSSNNHQYMYLISCRFSSHKIYQSFENGKRVDYRINPSIPDTSKETKPPIHTRDLIVEDNIHSRWVFRPSKYINRILCQLLPFGYPSSVKTGYGRFAAFQFLAAILGTVCGVISMQSLFHAVGIGSSSTPAIAAALNWIIKDGLGQLGGVLFASAVNSKFDADPKRWRLMAAVSLDLSCFIEVLSPLAPGYFLIIASIANVGKNISYLAASSSRAAIHKSFAIHENLGDVTAKTGSQSILASLIGTSIGISAASYMGDQFLYTTAFFLACSCTGLFSTYLSLKHVVINTFTITKLDVILDNFFANDIIMTPEQVMRREVCLGVLASPLPKLHIGSDLSIAAPLSTDIEVGLYMRWDMITVT
jgi:Vitamin B6 photo-protection and homoeostasis